MHGIIANEWPSAAETVSAWRVGPSVPTLFDAMRSAGRPSAALFGDDHLIGVTAGAGADVQWPMGEFAHDVDRDVLGYARDSETSERVRQVATQGAELIVAQFNETDTIGHLFGPDSPEALDHYRLVDTHLATVFEALKPEWSDWIVVVVSDHSQETVTDPEPIDLRTEAASRGLEGHVVDDGAAAIIGGPMAIDAAWIISVPGVAGLQRIGSGTVLAWSEPGRWFSSFEFPIRGVHGSPRTSAQLAVVTGGHPMVRSFQSPLHEGRPQSTWWAPAIAELLNIPSPCDLPRSVAPN